MPRDAKTAFLVTSVLLASIFCLLFVRGRQDKSDVWELHGQYKFQHSQPDDARRANQLIARLMKTDDIQELIAFLNMSPDDSISCSIKRIAGEPEVDLYSFYLNRMDTLSFSKPVDQCRAAQILVDIDSLRIRDKRMYVGYGDVVPTTDKTWVVDWELADGQRAEFEIINGKFVPF